MNEKTGQTEFIGMRISGFFHGSGGAVWWWYWTWKIFTIKCRVSFFGNSKGGSTISANIPDEAIVVI
jgi:hypothetical protein